MGLPLGSHVYLRAVIDGETVLRPYTPTSIAEQLGSFDLVVKVRMEKNGNELCM